MAKLTPKQQKWVDGVQKALNKPGGEGICFATGGDPFIILYEGGHDAEISSYSGDPLRVIHESGWLFDECLDFPSQVESWAT